jgi:hypothetical protein
VNDFDRAGRFRVRILSNAIQKQEKNDCVQFCAQIQAYEYHDDASKQWLDCSENDLGGYINVVIITKDGNINDSGIRQLRNALDWDGTDFKTLAQDFAGREVQVTVKSDTYEGQTRMKPSWLDHVDAEGMTLKSIDETGLAALNTRFMGALRGKASIGATAAPAKMAPPTKKF